MAEGNEEKINEELGDLLFSVVNLIRFRKGANSEELLRKAALKFETRFRYLERELDSQGKSLEEASCDEMESLWQRAKKETAL